MASILSFDNLTSRAEIPTFDYYTVWNRRMEDTLLRMYPQVDPKKVFITGTPQFDFHRRPEFLWSEAETRCRLGLPGRARYLLYAANHSQWTPTEPELIAALATRLEETADLKDVWLVVRLHPLDEPSRWRGFAKRAGQVVVCSPCISGRDADGWSLVGPDDQRLLVSTLFYSLACLNMCSTTALDAAVLDRPVIGVAFASVPESPETEVYREAYRSRHYRPLVESGGLRLARDWDEMLALIRRAIKYAEEDREARRVMVEQECGVVDGQATERIAKVILGLVKR